MARTTRRSQLLNGAICSGGRATKIDQPSRTASRIEKAEAEYDLNRAAELKYKTLRDAERKLQEAQRKASEARVGGTEFHEEVTEDEIAEVVSRWTGIPVTRLQEAEKDEHAPK